MSSDQELTTRSLRLLLVEDNQDDALLIERHLRKNGFAPEIIRVETPWEMSAALEAEQPPDFVLADYNLPQFSGPAALALVRRAELDIPFVMMSGAISEETAVESMRAGAHDYVTKQNIARLIPVLDRELREAAARRKRVAAELALRASETRFHRLVEAMPVGLLLSDSQGQITYANAATEKLLGYEPGAMVAAGLQLSSVLMLPEQEPFTVLLDAVATSPVEMQVHSASGSVVEALVGFAPLNPESQEERLTAAFIVDRTLHKNSE